jgi:hypothetical protein
MAVDWTAVVQRWIGSGRAWSTKQRIDGSGGNPIFDGTSVRRCRLNWVVCIAILPPKIFTTENLNENCTTCIADLGGLGLGGKPQAEHHLCTVGTGSPERFRAITESALEGLAKKELNLSAIVGRSAEAKERRLVPEVVE